MHTCPLCSSANWLQVRVVLAQPIRDYWAEMGVDLSALHPDFSDHIEEVKCADCGLHFFLPEIVGKAVLYETLTDQPDYYPSSKWEFTQVLELLAQERPGSLLEIGCGTGGFLRQAVRFSERMIGIDFNSKAITELKKAGLDGRETPVEQLGETFDVIAAFQVFEHVPNPGAMILSCLERLNPGGRLIIAVPNQDGALGDLQLNFLNLPPHHVTLWRRSCFDFIAERHGLKVETYLEEPISFEVYSALAFQHLRVFEKVGGFPSKVHNQIIRILQKAFLPSRFLSERGLLRGHTHLAVFRKAAV